MEKQNVTIALPKELLQRAKHLAIDRQTSLSKLLADTLEEIIQKDDAYSQARQRQLATMRRGFNMGLVGKIAWGRDELHGRR